MALAPTPLITLALLALACVEEPVDTAFSEERAYTIPELWDGEGIGFSRVIDAVVTSPRTEDGLAFYVMDRAGGSRSGLRVELAGVLASLPPPPGTAIALEGEVALDGDVPVLVLFDQDDTEVGEGGLALPVTPWSAETELRSTLVAVSGLTVSSPPDPLGEAETTLGPPLGGAFGAEPPGYGQLGDLTGVLTGDRLSPRFPEDWTGSFDDLPPTATTLVDLRAGLVPEGTWVALPDVVQATPWSSGGRYAVLQDAAGNGIWVDAQGFGAPPTTAGDRGRFLGEVRTSEPSGLVLHTWWTPEVAGTGSVVVRNELVDGALATATWTVPQGPDVAGDWAVAEGAVIDDRFVELPTLPDPLTVSGPVRVGSDGMVRHCPLTPP